MGAGGDDSSVAMQTATTREPIPVALSDLGVGDDVEAAREAVSVADDEPPEKLLSDDEIRSGLHNLGPTASGLRQAYLSLSVSSLQLTSLSGVERFSHLQTLIASRNNLGTDIQCLTSLRSLTHLDLSHNRLTTLLDGVLPQPLSLRYLDVSNNMISDVCGLSSFRHLEEVHLDDNRIENVNAETMQALPILKTLTLRRNKLRSLNGVRGASTLKHLDVSENALTKINELRGLTALTHLDISGNGLLTLGSMDELPLLGTLLMGDNCVSSLNGLLPLQKLTYLRRLAVKGNTLTQAYKARLHILYLLPSLTLLDDAEVRIEDKVEAANLHGADLEGLRSIRAKFFPNRADDEAHLLAPDEHSLGKATSVPAAVAASVAAGEEKGRAGGLGEIVGGSCGAPDGLSFDIPLDDLIDASEFGAYVLKNTSSQREAARACFDWMVANVLAPGSQYDAIADAAVSDDSALLRPDRCSAEVETMLCCGLGADGVNDSFVDDEDDDGDDVEDEELTTSDDVGTASADVTTISREASGDIDGNGVSIPWSRRIAKLYARLVASCGIECTIVRGVARFPGMPVGRRLTRSNHHWNVVTIDSQRCIVDCAWAAAGLDLDGFCIPPDEFVYQRFPEDPCDQLLDASISVQQFWSLPCLQPAFFAYNLRLQNHATSIVSVPAGSGEVNISVAAPVDVTLFHECRHVGLPLPIAAAAGPSPAAVSAPEGTTKDVSVSSRTSATENVHTNATEGGDDDDVVRNPGEHEATPTAAAAQSQAASAADEFNTGGNRTLAQRDLDGSFILRTALSGYSASFINVFAHSDSQTKPRLVLCYRIFREPPRVFDDSGRDNLHTLPVKVHSTDMDSTTNLCYPVVSRNFTMRGRHTRLYRKPFPWHIPLWCRLQFRDTLTDQSTVRVCSLMLLLCPHTHIITSICPIYTCTLLHPGCTIIDPIVGRLVEGSVETFRVRVPNATTVSVSANDGFRNILSRQYLKKPDDRSDIFVGQVCIPSSSCIVLATFGNDVQNREATDIDDDSLDAKADTSTAAGNDDVPILLHSYEVIQSRVSAAQQLDAGMDLPDSFDVSSLSI